MIKNTFKKRRGDSLADEQQIYLGWVDQVYVGESIHSLQARVDTTVQLPETNMTLFIDTQDNPLSINTVFSRESHVNIINTGHNKTTIELLKKYKNDNITLN